MALTHEKLEQIREKIVSRLKELEGQLTLTQESAKTVELDQALAGRVSRIDAIQQQKLAQAGLSRAKSKFEQLSKTLLQLDSEDFGYCEECGEEIKFARLLIKPESRYCIECQSQIE